jgi:putative ABC transport system substrate-binding protein
MISRRAFIRACGGALLAVPNAAPAQQAPRRYVIGVLGVASAATYAAQAAALRNGLRELGYVEGRNLATEFRWADGNASRLPALAAELVRLDPQVIVTSGPGNAVVKCATSSIPIVMAVSFDAVESGLVASLAHPGGNITGSTSFGSDLAVKRLEWLRQAFPRLDRVGLLVDRDTPTRTSTIQAVQQAGRTLKVEMVAVEVAGIADFDEAFAALAKARAGALVVVDHTVLIAAAAGISRRANAARLPVIGPVEIADTGGLFAYGVDFPVLWGRAAMFVDKILKGAKPADLPVERPTHFHSVVNLEAARALDVTVPQALLLRADRVIQ